MCEYCGNEFSRAGLTGHRRRCKRAKPQDRVARASAGKWSNRPESRSNFVALPTSRSPKSTNASIKINYTP